MKKKLLISILLAVSILCSATPALAGAGDADDPLVSRSYVDSTYSGALLDVPLANLRSSLTVLRYKLSLISGNVTVARPVSITAKTGDTITAYAGSSFTVLSGSLKVKSLTGTLIDVTDGSTVSSGQTLSAGHRYVSAELSVSGLSAASTVSVGALGNVSKTSAVNVSFSDVSANDWFYEPVYYAVEKGLVNGKSATSYDPNGTLTYAEAIKLAACMHQLYHTGAISLTNSASSGKWYADYVDYALNNGIIKNSLSNYEAVISRGEFIAIFYAAMPETEYAVKNTVGDNKIPDVSISDANAKEIYSFYRAGILVGADSAGYAYPNRGLMRSEVAAVINRMYEVTARKSITL